MTSERLAAIVLMGLFVGCPAGVIGYKLLRPEWSDDKTMAPALDVARTIERIRGCQDCELHMFIFLRDDSMISRRENWATNSNHNYHLIEDAAKRYPEAYQRITTEDD